MTQADTNRVFILQEIPAFSLQESHFELRAQPIPEPAEGEVLLRTLYMSIDAANRSWLKGKSYRAAVLPGDPMPTYAISEVIQSRSKHLAVGDIVSSESIWADYAVISARKARKMPKTGPLSHLISVYGIAGKTAYFGLISVGRPMAGETVLVSAAAGSVGGYVGQIAKALGCRVVGIAGGGEKCDWVCETLGFDACVDYRSADFKTALKSACPDGVDLYFDNVGGEILEQSLGLMNLRGRVVCCGAISQYDKAEVSGPKNLPSAVVVKRLRMEGFIVSDFLHDDAKAMRALQTWVQSGQIKVREDILQGLEQAPKALIGLLAGDNKGKRMVQVATLQS